VIDAQDLVPVFTTTNRTEADIIRNALRADGIACEVGERNQGGLTGIGDIHVLVRAIDADRAEAYLAKRPKNPKAGKD